MIKYIQAVEMQVRVYLNFYCFFFDISYKLFSKIDLIALKQSLIKKPNKYPLQNDTKKETVIPLLGHGQPNNF